MTCFFIGHHNAPGELRPALLNAVERHITEYGVREFIAGCYGAFDAMAAGAVREAKKLHPEVKLYLLTPYYPPRVEIYPGEYDGTLYPEGMELVPKRVAVKEADRLMIRRCEYLICYDRGSVGNTRELAAYARRREKRGLIRVTNLA